MEAAMKAEMLAALMLSGGVISASAQMCTAPHCSRNLIDACDPRCCDLPPSCLHGGPVRPAPPRFSPAPHLPPAPGLHGGI
jgi:hypothetical protein